MPSASCATSSLNRLFPWQQVLPQLELPVLKTALPAATRCPFCHGPRLYLYNDETYGGEWYYCWDCAATGDMIELATGVWKCSLREAVSRLYLPLPDAPSDDLPAELVNEYLRDFVEVRQRMRKLWQQSQQRFTTLDNETISKMHRRLMVRDNMVDWPHRGGQFVGAVHRNEVAACLAPGARPVVVGSKVHKGILRGAGWADVMVLPFWDLPGRVCACLFVGKETETGLTRIFQLAPQHPHNKNNEAGLALLPAILGAPNQYFQDVAFVFSEPETALDFQLRWLRSNMTPLPLIATYNDDQYATKNVWSWLPRNKLVFWSPTLNITTIAQAKRANGLVSLYEANQRDTLSGYSSRPPIDWLRVIHSQAAPWSVALQRLLKRTPSAHLDDMLLRIELPGHELRTFVDTCIPELQTKLHAICHARSFSRHIQYADRTIFEKDDAWYIAGHRGQSHLMCDAVIQLDQVLISARRQNYYRGVIRFQGKTVPFTAPVKVLDKSLFGWAKDYLLQTAGLGVLSYNTAWHSKAIHVATLFHKPAIVTGVDRIGWCPETLRFHFPKFTIEKDGEISQGYACLFDDASVPCRNLLPPATLPKKVAVALNEVNEETKTYWAVFVCLLANILADITRKPRQGIILAGNSAQSVGYLVSKQFGCTEPLHGNAVGNHLWPVITPLPLKTSYWTDSATASRSVIGLPPEAACLLGLRNNWYTVYNPRNIGTSQLLPPQLSAILPAYLQDLCSRKLWIEDTGKGVIHDLLDDLSGWLSRQGIAAQPLRECQPLIRCPAPDFPLNCFTELLVRFFLDRRMGFARADYTPTAKTRPSLVYFKATDTTPAAVWIPQRGFCDTAEIVARMPPDNLLITKALAEAGVLLREETYRQEIGWLVPEAWWNEELKRLEPELSAVL